LLLRHDEYLAPNEARNLALPYVDSDFVAVVEKRQGLKISCVEEIAFRLGYIDAIALRKLAESLKGSEYARYLMDVLGPKYV